MQRLKTAQDFENENLPTAATGLKGFGHSGQCMAGDFQATGVNVAGLNVTGLNVRDPTKLCFNRFITFSNWEKLLGKILSQTNIRKHAKSVRK